MAISAVQPLPVHEQDAKDLEESICSSTPETWERSIHSQELQTYITHESLLKALRAPHTQPSWTLQSTIARSCVQVWLKHNI